MNPNAKEFVPAYILKRRQEEAAQVDGLTTALDQTNLNGKSGGTTVENGETSTTSSNDSNNLKLGGDPTSNQAATAKEHEIQEIAGRSPSCNLTGTTTENENESKTENSSNNQDNNNQHPQNNSNRSNQQQNRINIDNGNHCNGGEAKENEPNHEDEDRYLLRAGENICEFNGEQFIIPGDEYEDEEDFEDHHHQMPGYDFGNAEDNEDQDICQAFDEFLENLPE